MIALPSTPELQAFALGLLVACAVIFFVAYGLWRLRL